MFIRVRKGKSNFNLMEKKIMKNEIRYCADLGMWATDRDILKSCNWKTPFCKNCYNWKLFSLYKDMKTKDVRNEEFWAELDGKGFKKYFGGKRSGATLKRFRFQTRGETFATVSDIHKVVDILEKNSNILFWIPTRAWRNEEMKALIEKHIFPLKNARVHASMDPTNTDKEWADVKSDGWSTMFYGDNDMIRNPNGDLSYLCDKTFFGEKGACATCKGGCFSEKRVDVHMKKH